MCKCERSPREDRKCVGFHKLSEEEWNEQKDTLVENYIEEEKMLKKLSDIIASEFD